MRRKAKPGLQKIPVAVFKDCLSHSLCNKLRAEHLTVERFDRDRTILLNQRSICRPEDANWFSQGITSRSTADNISSEFAEYQLDRYRFREVVF